MSYVADAAIATYSESHSGTVNTTDATPTIVLSETFTADGCYNLLLHVVGKQTSGGSNNGGGYGIVATVAREGSTIAIIDQDPLYTAHESTAGWNATLTTDGTIGCDVTVTGAGATDVSWSAVMLVKRVYG